MNILLVEDSSHYSNALAKTLRSEGHEVTQAKDFDSGVDVLVDTGMPDVIISDYDLGDHLGRNGYGFLSDVIEECRRRSIQTPILILHSGVRRVAPAGVTFIPKHRPEGIMELLQ